MEWKWLQGELQPGNHTHPCIYIHLPFVCKRKTAENKSLQGKGPSPIQMLLPDCPQSGSGFWASALSPSHPWKTSSCTAHESLLPKHGTHFHTSEPSDTPALPSQPLRTFLLAHTRKHPLLYEAPDAPGRANTSIALLDHTAVGRFHVPHSRRHQEHWDLKAQQPFKQLPGHVPGWLLSRNGGLNGDRRKEHHQNICE